MGWLLGMIFETVALVSKLIQRQKISLFLSNVPFTRSLLIDLCHNLTELFH